MNRKLKARIIEHFGTQADFAQTLDVDESLISRVVRGRRELSPEQKQEWAKHLESDPDEVFRPWD